MFLSKSCHPQSPSEDNHMFIDDPYMVYLKNEFRTLTELHMVLKDYPKILQGFDRNMQNEGTNKLEQRWDDWWWTHNRIPLRSSTLSGECQSWTWPGWMAGNKDCHFSISPGTPPLHSQSPHWIATCTEKHTRKGVMILFTLRIMTSCYTKQEWLQFMETNGKEWKYLYSMCKTSKLVFSGQSSFFLSV